MCYGQNKPFIRTSIWRSTLVFTLIMSLVFGGLLVTVFRVQNIMREQAVQQQVMVGVQAFTELALISDMTDEQFISHLENRAHATSENIIALKTADDELYGNLTQWPADVASFPDTSRFLVAVSAFDGLGDLSYVVASKIQTEFGRVVIGVFEPSTVAPQTQGLIASCVGLVLSLLLVGYLYNRRLLARLYEINDALGLIAKGQLSVRLPVSTRKDDYDLISARINEMVQTLADQVDAISAATDNIAHDLRTPLGRIRLALEDMTKEYDDHRLLQTIENVDQLIMTFNAMLELSRLEGGVMAMEEASVNLSVICADAAELVEALLTEHQCLQLDIADEVMVTGNSHLLFRVVYNLLENAIRYSGEWAEIRLHLQAAEVQGHAVLIVSDNGPGIPKDQYENAFKRLTRLDNSRTTAGFGMGLPVVRAVVQHHGGTVSLSSTEKDAEGERGLTVTIHF